MYLVRVTPPMNFTFSDDSLFHKKKILAGDINSLYLLVQTCLFLLSSFVDVIFLKYCM